MPVQLFGIGEAAFHRFFPAFVNLLAARLQTMSIHPVSRCLPHVSGHDLHHIPAARALRPQRAIPALTGVGVILPVTFPIGRAIHQQLLTRTYIHIAFGVIAELAFGEQALSMVRCPISCDPVNPALLQPFGIAVVAYPASSPTACTPNPNRSRCRSSRHRYGTESCTVAGVACVSVMIACFASTVRWSR